MTKFDYKRNILKRICQSNNIEYEEEKLELWTYYMDLNSEVDYQQFRIDSLPRENFEEDFIMEFMDPLARSGIQINVKTFFEEYVIKILFRYCENAEKNGDEIIVFIKDELLDLGISQEAWGNFTDVYKIVSSFDIHYEEESKYEYSSLSDAVYELEYEDKWLVKKCGHQNGMLFFDSVAQKYNLFYQETNYQLDGNYIGFKEGDYDFVPIVDIRYFSNLYFSMLEKKPAEEPVFAVEGTEENLRKIKKVIERKSKTFAICDYKDNHFYIKCLSGEDDELAFHLH